MKNTAIKAMNRNILAVPTIGIIHTPHLLVGNMPIQPIGAKGVEGVIELYPEYSLGLTDIDGFSHLILIYQFHQMKEYSLMVKPFMDNRQHGVFATRSPKRPSAIGISVVELIGVKENNLYFDGADMLDGTPLIDIKPFFRQTDNRLNARSGWLDEKEENIAEVTRSDWRFA